MGKIKVWPVLFFGIIFLLLGGVLATAQADDYGYELKIIESPTYGDEPIVVEFTNDSDEDIEVSGPVKIKVWSPAEWYEWYEWAVEELDPDGDKVFSGGTITAGDTVTIAEIAPGLPDTWRPYEQMDGELEFSLYIKIDGEYWHSPPLVHTVKKVETPNYDLVLTTNSPTWWKTPKGESIILKLTNNNGDPVTVSGPAVVQPLDMEGNKIADPERHPLMGGDTMTIAAGVKDVDVAEIKPGAPVSWKALYVPQPVVLQVWFQVDEGELGPRLWQSLITYHVVEGVLPIVGLSGAKGPAEDNKDGTATIGVTVNHHAWWNEFYADENYAQSDPRYVVGSAGGSPGKPATGLTRDQFFIQRPLEGGGQEHAGGTLLSAREVATGYYELCWCHEEGTYHIFLEASVPGSEEIWVLFGPPFMEVTISAPPKKVDAKLNPGTGRYEAQLSWRIVDLEISSAQEVDATIFLRRKGKSNHPPGPGLTPAGIYMEIEVTEGSLEGAEVLIEVAYSLEDLPPGMKESNLRLFRYNESRGEWELCGATEDERGVDTDRRVIWAIVSGFSEFAVFEYSPDVEAGAKAGVEAGAEAGVKAGAEEDEEAMADLPATAGTLPLLPVAGLALATAGLAVLRRKRHR